MNHQVQSISCNITYWLCSEPQISTNVYGNVKDNRIIIPVASNLIYGTYCFIVYANYDDKSVNIEGTFSTINILCEYTSIQTL